MVNEVITMILQTNHFSDKNFLKNKDFNFKINSNNFSRDRNNNYRNNYHFLQQRCSNHNSDFSMNFYNNPRDKKVSETLDVSCYNDQAIACFYFITNISNFFSLLPHFFVLMMESLLDSE